MTTDADAQLIARIRALTTPLAPLPTAMSPRVDPLIGIRAVLFDVYGTLVISGCGDIGLTATDDLPKAFAEAWRAAELDPRALPKGFDAATALTDKIRADHAASRAAGVDYPEVDIVAIWRRLLADLRISADDSRLRRLALEYELRTNPVWPMPGLAAVLATLAAQGLVLGLVSNAQFYTPLMLEAFLGRPLAAVGLDPDCCVLSYRQAVAKPSTAIYRPALDALQSRHGIAPEAVLYIGNDIRNDVQPAQALGCRTALFAGDARSLRLREDDPGLRRVVADRAVTELEQLTAQLLPAAPG
ncbi:MAG: HAD family hydrolase [Gammaproteobacteria bacterium]|jgi:putative hydrolase of the HAD superfamily|nr:HAD family hydrolase [Gammaproteobacteria bacterium]